MLQNFSTTSKIHASAKISDFRTEARTSNILRCTIQASTALRHQGLDTCITLNSSIVMLDFRT